MINKKQALQILDITLSTGADFGELFLEETHKTVTDLERGIITKRNSNVVYGCGMRLLKKDKCIYGYTNDVSVKGLTKLANTLKDSFSGTQEVRCFPLKVVKSANQHLPKLPYSEVPVQEQVNLMKLAYDNVMNYDKLIVKADIVFITDDKKITIYNSDGKIINDRHCRGRLGITAIAKYNDEMQANFTGPGAQKGFEFFKEEIDVAEIAKGVAKTAVTMVKAKECPAAVMPVIIDNGFGGVIFHEACGHPLEASAVSKKLSVFTDKIGQKIASDVVSAIDDGTIEGAWGSGNFDDEGNKTIRNVLIKDGVLQNYLIDNFNGRAMNAKGNGACRRESYKYAPTSRMSNTFIDNGKSTFEEILQSTEYGLYAKSLGGGSVNPTTGDFNFAVNEGYIVENGKIAYPVKGATLIGNGATILPLIDMVANNLKRAQGMCGAASGSIPADVGQPTIRVSKMTVGGRG